MFFEVSLEIADWRLQIADCHDNVFVFQSAIRNPQFHHQLRSTAA
jgi:hypothetical protein